MARKKLKNEIKVLVESLDLDVVKNANGNSSAGVRARRGLRLLKTKTIYEGLIRVEADAVVSALSSALAVSGAGDYGEDGPGSA